MTNLTEILTRTVTNIISNKDNLEKLLLSQKKLNIYLGIDPTATRIHIGHAVPLRKLKQFVDLGHNVTFLIGDFTALIGDTSDKEGERPVLTYKEIRENFKTYKRQASKILDFKKVDVKFNGEWLKKLNFTDVVKLCQHFSVGDFVSRELIKKRLNDGKKVALHEVLYPVMQGYDSYFMDTDVQVGGADQTFNMQAGRTLQKDLRAKESFVVVTGYLDGTDGRKMSKTWGNAIWIEDEPNEMFGKVMSLNDNLIVQYFTFGTNVPSEVIEEVKNRIESGENPLNIKKELALILVTEFHNREAAIAAKDYFEKTFQKKEIEYTEEIHSKDNLLETLTQTGKSKSEIKRLIAQKAIDVNGEIIENPQLKVSVGDNIKVGERTFLKS